MSLIKIDPTKKIVREIGLKYGLNFGESEEVFELFFKAIGEKIESVKKVKEGDLMIYDVKAPTIQVTNLGKFTVNQNKIKKYNKRLKNNYEFKFRK